MFKIGEAGKQLLSEAYSRQYLAVKGEVERLSSLSTLDSNDRFKFKALTWIEHLLRFDNLVGRVSDQGTVVNENDVIIANKENVNKLLGQAQHFNISKKDLDELLGLFNTSEQSLAQEYMPSPNGRSKK